MKRALAGVGSLAAVVAVAGALLLGSQALRGAHLTTADVIDSPSPTPTVQNCITPDNCPSQEPICVPGAGATCESTPTPPVAPTAVKPTPQSAPLACSSLGFAIEGWTDFRISPDVVALKFENRRSEPNRIGLLGRAFSVAAHQTVQFQMPRHRPLYIRITAITGGTAIQRCSSAPKR